MSLPADEPPTQPHNPANVLTRVGQFPSGERATLAKPSLATMITAFLTAFGAFTVLGLDPLEFPFAVRVGIPVLLAVVVGIAPVGWNVGLAWLIRVRTYQALRAFGLQIESNLSFQREQRREIELQLAEYLSHSDRFAILGLRIDPADGRDALVVARRAHRQLSKGHRLRVFDTISWEYLGSFEVIDTDDQTGYLALPTATPSEMWWSYLRQQAEQRRRVDTSAEAFTIRQSSKGVPDGDEDS